MFARRSGKPPIHQRLRQALWPSMGWRRTASYYSHRLQRLPGSPYTIAAGFASGAAVSFTPLIGLHFLVGALIALAVRGNLIAMAIGTVVGNPWTFPLIWLAIFKIGDFIIGAERPVGHAPPTLSLEAILAHPDEILVPMLVGGFVLGSVVWVVAYLIMARIVRTYRRLRYQRRRAAVRRREARREKAAARESQTSSEYGAQP